MFGWFIDREGILGRDYAPCARAVVIFRRLDWKRGLVVVLVVYCFRGLWFGLVT